MENVERPVEHSEEHQGVVAILSPDPTAARLAEWSSINTETLEGRRMWLKCGGKADYTGEDLPDSQIEICDIYCHQVELTDPGSGEVSQAIRVVLIGADGKTVSFVSYGIFKAVAKLAKLYGDVPWKIIPTVQIRRVRTRRGYTTYDLQLLSERGR